MLEINKACLIIITALLASCGGGGGKETSNSTLSDDKGQTVASLVLDGYLKDAIVFLDKNNNSLWDDGEPKTTTDSGGNYSLNLNASDYSNGEFTVVAQGVPFITVDMDYPTATIQSELLLKGVKGDRGLISPLTTLIHQEQITRGISSSVAEEIVRVYLGIPQGISLKADYLNPIALAQTPATAALANHAPLIAASIYASISSSQNYSAALMAAKQSYMQWASSRSPTTLDSINSNTKLSAVQLSNHIKSIAPGIAARIPLVMKVDGTPIDYKDNRNTTTSGSTTPSVPTSSGTTSSGSFTPTVPSSTGSTQPNIRISGSDIQTYNYSDTIITSSFYLLDTEGNKFISADSWNFAGLTSDKYTTENMVHLASGAEYKKLVINEVSGTSEFQVKVNAIKDGKTYTQNRIYKPSFRYTHQNSPLTLNHEHASPRPVMGKKVEWLNGQFTAYGFDVNGFVNRRFAIDLPAEVLDRYNAADMGYGTTFAQETDGEKFYFFVPGKDTGVCGSCTSLESGFLFVKVDLITKQVNYVEIKPPAPYLNGTDTRWNFQSFRDYVIAVRPVFTEGTNPPGTEDYRVDLQVVKIDWDGNILGSKTLSTNINNFGYPKGYLSFRYNPSPVQLAKHFNDLLIFGIGNSWVTTKPGAVNKTILSNNVFISLNTLNLTQNQPFIIQAPKWQLHVNHLNASLQLSSVDAFGGIERSYTPKSQIAHGSFNRINSNANNWSSTSSILDDYTQGGLILNLGTSSYDGVTLTSWGNAQISSSFFNSQQGYNNNFRYWGGSQVIGSKSELVFTHFGLIENNYMLEYPNYGKCRNGWVSSGLIDYSIDCNNAFGYFLFTNQGLNFGKLNSRHDSGLWSLLYTTPQSKWSKSNSLWIGKSGDYSGSELELDVKGQHEGCTLPVAKNLPQVPVATLNETVNLERFLAPPTSDLALTKKNGVGAVNVYPYFDRAPILCSVFKVNLDQTHVIKAGTKITPQLNAKYQRTLHAPPSNGTYDPVANTYTPNSNFAGNDSFKITIDDKTGGTQVVTIDVTVFK
jgi:hypothetical protein